MLTRILAVRELRCEREAGRDQSSASAGGATGSLWSGPLFTRNMFSLVTPGLQWERERERCLKVGLRPRLEACLKIRLYVFGSTRFCFFCICTLQRLFYDMVFILFGQWFKCSPNDSSSDMSPEPDRDMSSRFYSWKCRGTSHRCSSLELTASNWSTSHSAENFRTLQYPSMVLEGEDAVHVKSILIVNLVFLRLSSFYC